MGSSCAALCRKSSDRHVTEVSEEKKLSDGAATASTAPPPEHMRAFSKEAESDATVEAEMEAENVWAIPSPPNGDSCLVPRPLTDEERERAWRAANYIDATAGNASPIALWILGPSSVGKSTLTAEVGPSFGIPKLPGAKGRRISHAPSERCGPLAHPEDMRCRLDAVIIDGEYMRDAHEVWQRWVKTPDWRAAYPAMKSTINAEKDRMEAEAVSGKKNLIIPQTMLHLHKGFADVEKLCKLGYTNHVLAIVAPLEECQVRGRAREIETGKRYQPLEFEQSIAAIPKIIAACNGRYQVIRAVEENDGALQELGYRRLAAGNAGNHTSVSLPGALDDADLCFNAEELTSVIAESISSKASVE